MNTSLWIVQGIIALLFLWIGFMKSTFSREKLTKIGMSTDISLGTLRFIGIAEILGAIGLIVPMLTGIAPILTPIAAAALSIIMLLAAVYHFRKHENKPVAFNVLLLVLVVFIAVGRF
jgi:uncharacterized membrane protein